MQIELMRPLNEIWEKKTLRIQSGDCRPTLKPFPRTLKILSRKPQNILYRLIWGRPATIPRKTGNGERELSQADHPDLTALVGIAMQMAEFG